MSTQIFIPISNQKFNMGLRLEQMSATVRVSQLYCNHSYLRLHNPHSSGSTFTTGRHRAD
eukprot:6474448-Amphidinium_carterae.3